MNFLYNRQKTPGHILQMPEGLQELMSDISREVLRCQPSADCTYKFIADYLDAMVKTRDKCKIAMDIIEEAILKTDEVYSQFAKCNFPKEKTDKFLDVMEITFRRFVDKKRKQNEDQRFIKFHADDMLEELMRKCDLSKVEVLRSKPAIQWAFRKFLKTYLAAIEETLDTEDLYFETEKVIASSKELDQMHQKAIQIQKVYRGYQTRKSLKETQRIQFAKNQVSDSSSSTSSFREFLLSRQEEMTKAAIKIQASFKGFCVRKKNPLEKKKVSLKPYLPVPPLFMDSISTEESLFENLDCPPNSFEKFEPRSSFHESDQVITEEAPNTILEETAENFAETNIETQSLNEAAVKIQATYKGYRTRKDLSHSTTENSTKPSNSTEQAKNSNIHPETLENLQD